MGIQFYAKRNQYVLETPDSTYSFFHYGNQLICGYWGARLQHADELPMPGMKINHVFGEGQLNRMLYTNEYVGWGSFFYAEPTLKVTFADGVRDLHLEVISCDIEDEHTLTALYRDRDYDLSVKLFYRIYDGLNIIDRSCVITNNTGGVVTIHSAASATFTFPYREEPYRLTSLGSSWGHEYDIQRTPVTKAKTVIESRAGLSNAQNFPYFALDEGRASENDGEVWFGTLQWCGNGKITVELDTVKQMRVTGGVNDFDFSYQLKAGESFETPVFTLGYTKEGFSGASRQLHDYTRFYQYGGYWADRCLPVLYNTFWTYGITGVEEQNLLDIVDRVADMGVELFVVDDGWYSTAWRGESGLGDWWPSPERFPNGLTRLIEAVNARGMMFGIWIEPEMVVADTELYREHPEWVISFPTRERETSLGRMILNLADEEVYQYIVDVLDELLDNHNIGYLKWDMNRWFTEPGRMDRAAGEWQSIWYDYARNLYRIFEHLNLKYPELIIENCASGGLRTDLSMAKYCSRINRSDNQDPVDELYLHEGFTYVNLSRAAGGAGHITLSGFGLQRRECPMEFKARISYMGSQAVGIDIAKATEEQLAEIRTYVARFKELRHIVQLGDIYRLSSLRESDFMAVEYVSKDQSEALVLLFCPCGKFMNPTADLRLYGLHPDKRYLVTYEPTALQPNGGSLEMSGDTLMKKGIPEDRYTLGNMSSALFYLKAEA